MKNDRELNQIVNYYNKSTSQSNMHLTNTTIEFNDYELKGNDSPIIHEIERKHDIDISTYEQFKNVWYNINGGLIFVGSLVSLVLFIGIFLIIYYKQVSEAQEDVQNYLTMEHLGIDNQKSNTYWINN
ncbi:hypothetical protein I6J36_12605 [Staphylococcus pasteuri]|uniref:hypothetical protein n=1 Tax=Staphylococcus pasteuri TaxID=45972 RepID=UPI001AD88189|nr:hypothetical protein [Staphylococcus pasteuri]MBM6508344.1 hypothetical protein [Staphylococcus pasteuri]